VVWTIPFGFPVVPEVIEHVERMLAIERLGGTVFANALIERVPPVVATLLHDDGTAGAFEHDHVADAGHPASRFVHCVLEAAPLCRAARRRRR